MGVIGGGLRRFVKLGTNWEDNKRRLKRNMELLSGLWESLTSTGLIVTEDGQIEVNPGEIDHGELAGLGDDDHTQYLLDDAATGGDGIAVSSRAIAVDLATDPGLEFSSNALRVKAGTNMARRASTGELDMVPGKDATFPTVGGGELQARNGTTNSLHGTARAALDVTNGRLILDTAFANFSAPAAYGIESGSGIKIGMSSTGEAGAIRYNTSDQIIEGYWGGQWNPFGNPFRQAQTAAGSKVTVANTTTETNIFLFDIAANRLFNNQGFRFFLHGDLKNNSGGDADLTIRVKHGPDGGSYTTIWAATVTIPDSATVRPWMIQLDFSGEAVTQDAHRVQGTIELNDNVGATTGQGGFGTPTAAIVQGTSTQLGNVATEFLITVEWDTADADTTITKEMDTVERFE